MSKDHPFNGAGIKASCLHPLRFSGDCPLLLSLPARTAPSAQSRLRFRPPPAQPIARARPPCSIAKGASIVAPAMLWTVTIAIGRDATELRDRSSLRDRRSAPLSGVRALRGSVGPSRRIRSEERSGGIPKYQESHVAQNAETNGGSPECPATPQPLDGTRQTTRFVTPSRGDLVEPNPF